MKRYMVVRVFHPALRWMSEIRDTEGAKLILVAGVDHEKRALARAAALEAQDQHSRLGVEGSCEATR